MAEPVTQAEVEQAGIDSAIQSIRIIERQHGFELQLKLTGKRGYCYLATMRDTAKARNYKSLDRLLTIIRSHLKYAGDIQLQHVTTFSGYYTVQHLKAS